MEFLREEEQEENQVLSKEEFEPANDHHEGSVQFEEEDEAKPKEAWTGTAMTYSKTSSVSMLAVIGRFLLF